MSYIVDGNFDHIFAIEGSHLWGLA